MIEGLKSDELVEKFGGRFKLTALVQRRLVELLQGARPMVETEGLTDIEVVVKEILDGKVDLRWAEDEEGEPDADE